MFLALFEIYYGRTSTALPRRDTGTNKEHPSFLDLNETFEICRTAKSKGYFFLLQR